MRIDSDLLAWLGGYCHKTGEDRTHIVTSLLEALRDNRLTVYSEGDPEEGARKNARLDFSFLTPDERREAKAKFDARWNLEPTTGCWIWHTPSTSFYWKGNPFTASRFSLAFHKMPIPAGKFACHTCDNPRCVNPDHLWVGTAFEDTKELVREGRQYLGPNWVPPVKHQPFVSPDRALAFPASHNEAEINFALERHNKRGS
jgi:hypothetical protein